MLHYTEHINENSEEWVTFIHGAGGDSNLFYKQLRDFTKHFNVLLIDLRGHGKSKISETVKRYTFEFIAKDVIEVFDHLGIKKAHFVGISLGTILTMEIARIKPELVSSMILGGAVMRLNIKSQLLLGFGIVFKNFLPYMALYKLYARIILPLRNHSESRNLLISQAKSLAQKEFERWFRLTAQINKKLRFFRLEEFNIPTFYIMGDQDHMFLPSIKKLVSRQELCSLYVIPDCGHVVNIDKPKIFNQQSINFLTSVV